MFRRPFSLAAQANLSGRPRVDSAMPSKKQRMPEPAEASHASKAERLDAALAAGAVRHRKNPAVRVLGTLAELADQPPLLAGSAATIAAGLALGRPRLARAGVRMLASELVATGIKAAVKHHVVRTRPHKMLKDGRYVLDTDKHGDKDEGPWNSFPSGHTAGAVAVGRALTREYPQAAPAVAVAATLVAVIQLPRGTHFASDVVAGAAIGWGSERIVDGAVRAVDRTRSGED
jgi:membrane-associated phospholipid phosphatase